MNAVLMASGLGTRMRPLTEHTPKPLISVCGKPMIETVIEGLEEAKVDIIYVVVGYLGEQFQYLLDKYANLQILQNKDYETVNNISSIYTAREVLKEADCFICEADLYVSDSSLFSIPLEHSCYYGKMVEGHSEDWVFEQDTNGLITRIGKKGNDCYNMVGVSFLKKKEANIIAKEVEKIYGTSGYEQLFWDDVVNQSLDELKLYIQPILEEQIVEIDTVLELKAVEMQLEGKEGK